MGNELVHAVFTVIEVKPFRRKSVKYSMSKYVVNPFANKALELAYAPEINDLNRRIVRRKELMKEFLRRSSDATTKKFKAMWKNLSKGHLFQKRKLETDKRFFIGVFILFSIIAVVAYNLLSAPSVIDVIAAIGRLLFRLM